MALQAEAHRALDAVADLEVGNAFLLHILDGAQVGALAGIGQDLERPAGKQPVGLAHRQFQPPRRQPQGRPAPAVEDGLGGDGIGQPVAQFGVGIGRRSRRGLIGAIFSTHNGKYRCPAGLPKASAL